MSTHGNSLFSRAPFYHCYTIGVHQILSLALCAFWLFVSCFAKKTGTSIFFCINMHSANFVFHMKLLMLLFFLSFFDLGFKTWWPMYPCIWNWSKMKIYQKYLQGSSLLVNLQNYNLNFAGNELLYSCFIRVLIIIS